MVNRDMCSRVQKEIDFQPENNLSRVSVSAYKFCDHLATACMADIYTNNSSDKYSTIHELNLPGKNLDIGLNGL